MCHSFPRAVLTSAGEETRIERKKEESVNPMAYYIGQGMGILATACCVFTPFFKKKWQMLVMSALANFCFMMNLILLGESGSAGVLGVIFFQSLLSLWHVLKEIPVTKAENIGFIILYVVTGLMGYEKIIDILPVLGACFSSLGVFQRDEQKTRFLILLNAVAYSTYYIIIGSTYMLAELITVVGNAAAMIRYRKKADH